MPRNSSSEDKKPFVFKTKTGGNISTRFLLQEK
jgi:hypothetical protein